jgi:hypothetical protein
MTSFAEKRAFLYGLHTHKKMEHDCPQKSDVSALRPFVLLSGASGGFQWIKNGEPVSLCHEFGLVAYWCFWAF